MKTALSIIRTRCNYSQAALAESIGVSRQMVCAWENGGKKLPDSRADELAVLFGVPSAILKEDDLQKVEQWCDRPLFPAEKQGRQVFSFEPADGSANYGVFLLRPEDPVPAVRSRELALKRNAVLQSLDDLSKVRADQQSRDLNYAEPCVSILERIQTLLECAAQLEDPIRERMLFFLLEQLFLLECIFTGKEAGQEEPTDWQKQQVQILRSHWAQVNRVCCDKAKQAAIRLPEDGEEKHMGLAERLNGLYHCAVKQGISRRDLQLYLEKIIMEEYDDERQN